MPQSARVCLAKFCSTHRSVPPPANDDLPTGKHNALVRPEVVVRDVCDVVLEVLHEGDALPAGDVALRRERVEPAVDVEAVAHIIAVAFEADRSGGRGGGLPALPVGY